MQLVKMRREDDGHEVDVHPEMVADYMTGGYRIDENAKPEAQTETPVKRRGRPRKAD